MKYQSVAILGAGAVGSYVMWGLAKKKEIDLCVSSDQVLSAGDCGSDRGSHHLPVCVCYAL